MNWIITNDYVFGSYGKTRKLTKKSQIAAFDLDHTIIKPSNGKRFSDSDNDWEFYDQYVIKKLETYYEDGYDIVIVSNQGGIPKGKTNLEVWKKKIENIANKLAIPFVILASLHNDQYRKPRTGLWDKFIKYNPKRSFYCGDAGGLPKRKIKGIQLKKDFSDSDLKFAHNIGVPFIHRDLLIFNHNASTSIKYGVDFKKIKEEKMHKFKPSEDLEMIINVGYPGSGKSYYTNKYILECNIDYKYINRDTLKTAKKCMKECTDAIKNGYSVVIDNTNPSPIERKKYIDLAKQYDINVRCLYFNTSKELSMHNNIYRHIVSNGATKIVPTIAYNIFKKKFVQPIMSEGYYKIETIEFALDPDSDINEDIYHNYLF